MPCAVVNPGDLEILVQFPDLLSHSLYLRRQEHCVSHGLLPWRGKSLPLDFPLGLLALHQHSRGSCPALPLTGWHLQPKGQGEKEAKPQWVSSASHLGHIRPEVPSLGVFIMCTVLIPRHQGPYWARCCTNILMIRSLPQRASKSSVS